MKLEEALSKKNVRIGQKIRFFRRGMGLTQKELAERICVSYQQFQKYETGQNRISAASLEIIAEILHVPIEKFFEYTGKRFRQVDKRGLKLMQLFQDIRQEPLKEHLLQSAELYTTIRRRRK